MWTSASRNHTSKHHSPLAGQPDILIAARAPGRANAQNASAAAFDLERQPSQPPLLNGAGSAYGTSAACQCLALDPALIRAHPPAAVAGVGDEIHVGALRCERGVKPQQSTAVREGDSVDVVDQHDEVRHADS